MKTILLFLILLVGCDVTFAGPKVQTTPTPTPTPAPVYNMTQAEYDATILHRDVLTKQRDTALTTANDALTKQIATLTLEGTVNVNNAKLVPNLQTQITALNSTITTLKRENFWDKWKFSIIGIGVGLVVAVVSFFVAKMAGYIAVTGATVAAKVP